jgi:mono/diheme cytochrome c family protein
MHKPLKSLLLFSVVTLIALAARPLLGGRPQEATPETAPAAASAQAPAAPAVENKNPGKINAEAQAKAKKIYTVDCAMCHGDNGDGQTDVGKSVGLSENWTEAKTLAGKQDQALFDLIRKGKGNMPSEAEGRADNNTVWNLIHYIRTMSKP